MQAGDVQRIRAKWKCSTYTPRIVDGQRKTYVNIPSGCQLSQSRYFTGSDFYVDFLYTSRYGGWRYAGKLLSYPISNGEGSLTCGITKDNIKKELAPKDLYVYATGPVENEYILENGSHIVVQNGSFINVAFEKQNENYDPITNKTKYRIGLERPTYNGSYIPLNYYESMMSNGIFSTGYVFGVNFQVIDISAVSERPPTRQIQAIYWPWQYTVMEAPHRSSAYYDKNNIYHSARTYSNYYENNRFVDEDKRLYTLVRGTDYGERDGWYAYYGYYGNVFSGTRWDTPQYNFKYLGNELVTFVQNKNGERFNMFHNYINSYGYHEVLMDEDNYNGVDYDCPHIEVVQWYTYKPFFTNAEPVYQDVPYYCYQRDYFANYYRSSFPVINSVDSAIDAGDLTKSYNVTNNNTVINKFFFDRELEARGTTIEEFAEEVYGPGKTVTVNGPSRGDVLLPGFVSNVVSVPIVSLVDLGRTVEFYADWVESPYLASNKIDKYTQKISDHRYKYVFYEE